MSIFGSKPKCAIAGCACPETNDNSRDLYCPNWVVGLPQTEPDGSGRFTQGSFTGCFLVNQPAYMLSIAATASHAAASYDSARNKLVNITNEPALKAVLEMGLTVAAGSIQTARGTLLDGKPASGEGKKQIEQEVNNG